jgi:hypothetical protein
MGHLGIPHAPDGADVIVDACETRRFFPAPGAAEAKIIVIIVLGKNSAEKRLFAQSRDNVRALNALSGFGSQVFRSF